ncbi:MAG: hypothetical protein JSS32_09810 [Verrucomicrobia bacterium]|nr:hypothetical protein [Verrucomicrobiota bacterium]
MQIEGLSSDDAGLSIEELARNKEGYDGQRTYTLLEKGEICGCREKKMTELGIEKIAFEVYQLAETKLFDMDFKIAAPNGNSVCLHFPNRSVSMSGYLGFFSEVENEASNIGAFGLATLANQAAVVASRYQLPPDRNSAYLRCMDACEEIDFELLKLLCYLLCLKADDTPGS